MKKIILQLCIATGLVVAASVTGFSQISQSYRAHIPFDFAVKDTQMKAGDYRISPILSSAGIGALQLLDVDHVALVFIYLCEDAPQSRHRTYVLLHREGRDRLVAEWEDRLARSDY